MKLLTVARDLRRRKARARDARFVVEGVRAVEELLRSPLAVHGALVAPQLRNAPRGAALRDALAARGVPVEEVSERDFASAADTDAPQGVLVVAEVPARDFGALPAHGPATLLVLDAVQDPGNVGALVRTAAALGADATVALPGTVDLWNAKVVRAAVAAQCHHHAFHATWDALVAFLDAASFVLWAADADGAPPGAAAGARVALAVGNEGAGLSPAVRARADRVVGIPITSQVESLNVAVAAGILLHGLRR